MKYEDQIALAKQLIDRPGFGSARDVLVSKRLWDESRDPENKKFYVTLVGTYDLDDIEIEMYAEVDVYARDVQEAWGRANLLDVGPGEWECDDPDYQHLYLSEPDDWEVSEIVLADESP